MPTWWQQFKLGKILSMLKLLPLLLFIVILNRTNSRCLHGKSAWKSTPLKMLVNLNKSVAFCSLAHNKFRTLRPETIFINWKFFKNDERYLLFHLKSFLVLKKILKFLSCLFSHIEKQLEREISFQNLWRHNLVK